jgi:hypothetical protein
VTATEIVQTALGPVEVGRRGTGAPVLFVHGTPGGSDSSLVMGRFLAEAGFEVIAVAGGTSERRSRDGRRSTPRPTCTRRSSPSSDTTGPAS